MSSFFTLPASQRKRKRDQSSRGQQSRNGASKARPRVNDDESISGSDISDREDGVGSADESDDDNANEDAASKRIRLAEQYLANTRKEALEEVGFDAEDIDQENLRRRMGERLKEDTAETKGKLYKHIADDLDWRSCRAIQFRADTKSVTGIAMAAGFVYTVSKDMALIKWKLAAPGQTQKPKKVKFTRGDRYATKHHDAAILCVAASADGKFVVTGGADNKLIIWNAADLTMLKIFSGRHRDNGHRDSVLGLAFRRSSNQLYSCSKDRTVKVWSCDELAFVETLFGHQDEVLDVAALGKEVCVSAGARDRTARYWQVIDETQLVFRGGGTIKSRDSAVDLEAAGQEGSIERIAFVDDDNFVTGSDNGTLTLWNINRKKPVFSVPLVHGLQPPPSLEARSAELDIDDQYRDMELLGELPSQPRWITALRVLPYSNVVLSGSWDGHIRIFKITPDKRRLEELDTTGSEETMIQGVINDIAVIEAGDRGRDGLIIAAAVGQEHRLGRWQQCQGKNAAYLFNVPRSLPLEDKDELHSNGVEGETFEGLE